MRVCFILLISIFCLTDCTDKNIDYVLDKNISEVGFKLKSSPSIIGKEICTLLYFEGSNYKIVKAYYDCNNYTPKSVDIENGKINCCHENLYLEGDTVKICLVKLDTGIFKFSKIKLLFTDKQNHYYVADTTFQYFVRDSI